MNEHNLASALAYYSAMQNKDIEGIKKYLHPHVQLVGPLAQVLGKEAVLEAAKKLMGIIKDITIRAKFSADDQVMFAYDWEISPPIGMLRAAVLMTFHEGLIAKIELFFDARPFIGNAR